MRRPLPLLTLAAMLCGCAAALADSTNGGWSGQTEPNDPGYAAAEHNPLSSCINDEDWFLFSKIPTCTPLAHDPQGSAGMFIDQAWRQFTIGRPDVRIAYMEAGVNWHDPVARAELAPRTYLNTGELPLPEHADGSTCGSYDCNGDGVVNVFDYAEDPRVKRPYINGSITPEDLIAAFGDCKLTATHRIAFCRPGHHYDNDHDGYPNDISGWNFMYANNDPSTPDGAYPHSDSQMERAAAEGNNGVKEVGVCPGCMVIPIKAGHEALDRTDRVAQSIYFAVANGASVIDLLTAELGYSRATRRALDWAWKRGVVVVGASNDFDSSDHQEGMFWPRMWPGNGIVADGSGTIPALAKTDRLTTTYRDRSNFTSFGPHDLFSTPNKGGTTSESQPTQAGVAALIASEGRDAADRRQIAAPLNAGEITQVVRETASNIDDPNLGWPGKPGATFNIQYGYGRPDVLAAMQAVAANRIPPVPDILAPDWYTLADPTKTRLLPIRADIEAHRANGFSWRIQYGLGPDPTEAQFVTIAGGHTTRHSLTGTLARLDLRRIPRSFWARPFGYTTDLSSTEQYDVTIRVQATDDRGLMGEDRRTIAVHHDPGLRRNFPVRLTGGAPAASPELADLLGNGRLDIIFGDSNGYVHAIDPDSGRELHGWPAHTSTVDFRLARASAAGAARAVPRRVREPIVAPAAVGDLFGNGGIDVVVSTTSGRVYAFDRRGRLLRGFPRSLGAGAAREPIVPPQADYVRPPSLGSFAAPVLAHLPRSPTKLDIIQAAWDGNLYAFDGRGRNVPGWPVSGQLPASDRPRSPYIDVHDYKIISTPTLADLFGDGRREIVIKSQEWAYDTTDPLAGSLGYRSRFYELAFWADGRRHPGGALVPGFPVQLQGELGDYGSAQDWITEGGDTPAAARLGAGGDTLGQNLFLAVPQFFTRAGTAPQSQPQPNVAVVLAQRAATAQPGLNGDRVATSDTAGDPATFTTSGVMARLNGQVAYISAGVDLDSLTALLHAGIAQRLTNFMFAWDARSGKMLPGFGAPMMGLPFLTAPAVADITGGGQPDLINNEDSGNIAAYDAFGRPVAGWPKFTGGWSLDTPAVGDLDGSGHVSVVTVTREGYLFAWDTPGRPGAVQVWGWHQNDWHTGRLGDETRSPSAPMRLRVQRRPRGGVRLCWRAGGGTWGDGRAARYELRLFARRPEPESFASGRRIRGLRPPRPDPARSRQCLSIPRLPQGARWLGLRAVNRAGLLSMPGAVRL